MTKPSQRALQQAGWAGGGSRLLLAALTLLVLFSGADVRAQTNLVTPAQYLATLSKPRFKTGHRLPHLTWAGWPLPETLKIEVATNWGYTLELNDADPTLVASITNTNSETYRLIALAKKHPDKFAISIGVHRLWAHQMSAFPPPPAGFYCTNASGLFVNNSTNTWSDIHDLSNAKFVSPEAPDSYLETISDYQASFIRSVRSNVPIAIVLNAGEYGLGVPGGEVTGWLKDPRVQAATNGMGMPRYASNRKAHQLGFLTSRIHDALPDRELYIFYNTGLEQSRYHQPGYNYELYGAMWGWFSDVMNTNTDLPSFESYYMGPTSWTNAAGAKWNNVTDLLTRHLNAVSFNLTLGYPHNYSWLNGGNSNNNSNKLSEIPRYIGFLKCLYTSGMVGGIAGYYDFPTNTVPTIFGHNGFTGSFPTNLPPHWLQQIAATARVHALFSHLDNYLYEGDLLSGPQKHFVSTDLPACEFTNTVADANVRVLARKLRTRDEWLITAWAAHGSDRPATVTIPALGPVTVLARDCGSVYRATATNLTLVDVNGLMPTESTVGRPGTPRAVPMVTE